MAIRCRRVRTRPAHRRRMVSVEEAVLPRLSVILWGDGILADQILNYHRL
jgi:hypothetical protein